MIISDIAPRIECNMLESTMTGRIVEFLAKSSLLSIDAKRQNLLQITNNNQQIVQFLMRKSNFVDNKWRFPIKATRDGLACLSRIQFTKDWYRMPDMPVLVLKGSDSEQWKDSNDDDSLFRQWFPKVQIEWIKGAGHWIHHDKQEEFCSIIIKFISEQQFEE